MTSWNGESKGIGFGHTTMNLSFRRGQREWVSAVLNSVEYTGTGTNIGRKAWAPSLQSYSILYQANQATQPFGYFLAHHFLASSHSKIHNPKATGKKKYSTGILLELIAVVNPGM